MWIKHTYEAVKEMEQILCGIIERTLMVPLSTHRDVLQMETGFMDFLNKTNMVRMEDQEKHRLTL